MIVGDEASVRDGYPALDVTCYPGKKALAQAVIATAKANRQQRFFFHGQFNTGLWLALLSGGIRPSQFNWHIWGADLYENSASLKFRSALSAAPYGAGAGRARFRHPRRSQLVR